MSRLPIPYVWLNYFGPKKPEALCPSCLESRMKKNDMKTWNRGHIIPARDKPPDVYSNLRPICIECNKNDRTYETNYHYMVAIGTMQKEDLEPALAKIRLAFKQQESTPEFFQCKRCYCARIPRSKYCGKHKKIEFRRRTEVEKDYIQMRSSLCKHLKMNFWDEYELDAFKNMLDDVNYLLAWEYDAAHMETGIPPF